MKLPALRFNGEILPHNPHTLRITYARDIKQAAIPYFGEIYGDYGRRARVVTGEGELYGDNAFDVFLSLVRAHDSGTEGILSIPDMPPFMAVLRELTLTREPKDGVIAYSFRFIEKTDIKSADTQSEHTVTLENDTNLWEIAAKYGCAIEKLVENNPDIETPYTLIAAGREVFL